MSGSAWIPFQNNHWTSLENFRVIDSGLTKRKIHALYRLDRWLAVAHPSIYTPVFLPQSFLMPSSISVFSSSFFLSSSVSSSSSIFWFYLCTSSICLFLPSPTSNRLQFLSLSPPLFLPPSPSPPPPGIRIISTAPSSRIPVFLLLRLSDADLIRFGAFLLPFLSFYSLISSLSFGVVRFPLLLVWCLPIAALISTRC